MSNIFIISAPSGCGKTSLVRELCQTYSFLEQTVSYTTRTIRSGEVEGEDYHFISKDEFIENKKNNKFIESQKVYDNFYGTTYESINTILASGKDAILEIDYKDPYPNDISWGENSDYVPSMKPRDQYGQIFGGGLDIQLKSGAYLFLRHTFFPSFTASKYKNFSWQYQLNS